MYAERKATHAGSWYEENTNILHQKLANWLGELEQEKYILKAIISPHAG